MRGTGISTHPGQHIVLSSARPAVAEASIGELAYHDLLLTAFALDHSHKIVLHVGAGAADAEAALDRFAAAFARLPAGAARRLVLENDERWPLAPVLELARRLRLPVVFDVFHHRLAPSLEGASVRKLVLRAAATWRGGDGRQEVHFSTQEPGKRPGAHAEALDTAEFERFADEVADLPIDCIVEVKHNERSALLAQKLLRARR
jgi:UV DNA damage endonuclease